MKVCELCGGAGHRSTHLCMNCSGTGLICLGHESAERYAGLIEQARLKAEREGWTEEVWIPLSATEQRDQYPRMARKMRIRVTVEQPSAKDVA